MTHQPASVAHAARRSDAGVMRLTSRDITGLALIGDMYGAPYDLLADCLGVRSDRLRGIVARWRNAGYVQTGRLGSGPAWCWLTRRGLAVTGQRYTATRPAAARLAHLRAVLAIRLSLEAGTAYREGKGWWRSELPPGWYIAAHYWDIESGGLDLEQRGHGTAHQQVDVGIPRDGGLAGLLAEAGGPAPRFAAVMCEDIERSGRDTFNALKLERQLNDAGIPLFATDEPINVEGMNATTILVRRVKQGIAEWYRFQLKEKAWRGFQQHTIDGYNIGPAPYGYAPQRIPHPNPAKATQGRTKTRLTLDPDRAPVVEQIYLWRAEDKLGMNTIVNRLNADPARYPSTGNRGWTVTSVAAILANPKYTGYMVYGRRRATPGYRKGKIVPQEQWLWSPQPTHPAIISRALWDEAQRTGHGHPDTQPHDPSQEQPTFRRAYVLWSRIWCRDCNRRMRGTLTRPRPASAGYIYYDCPHRTTNPRNYAQYPEHPTTVRIREDVLMTVIKTFCDQRVFGPDRAAMLARQLPASAADAAERRDQQVTAMRKRLRQIDAAERAHAREIEALTSIEDDSPALEALRSRIIERFKELEADRAEINTQLAALERQAEHANDPTLLDALPQIIGAFDHIPARLRTALFQALGLEVVYNKQDHQVSIYATITPATPRALAAIIATSEPPRPAPTSTPADGDGDGAVSHSLRAPSFPAVWHSGAT